ncbi:MAG: ATP-binding cassette, subfamily bacterial, partial [Actinomycetota bacterium]|nr:ATP-binding cassette, subfamily bacterial [Actinomycetota bacterium]
MGWWGDNVPEETLSRDEASRVVRRLFRMLRPQRARIVVATFVLMAQAAALLAGPLLVRHGIDAGLPSAKHGGDAGALDLAVVIYLVLAFAGLALGRFAIVLVARIGEGFLKELRNRLFGHMMSLSLDYFETEKTGKIVARMT